MAIRRNRAVSKLAKTVSADGTFSTESLADDFVLRVDVYDSVGELPITNLVNGTQAFVPSSKRFYLSDGNGWYSVAAVNSTPTIQSITDSNGEPGPFALSKAGNQSVITVTVLDSDADPLTYTFSKDADFDGLATITQAQNVFTVFPLSQDSATTTSGTVTFTVTDDVNTAASTQTFTLEFFFNANTIDTLSIDESGSISRTLPSAYQPSRGIAISPDETNVYYCAYAANRIQQGVMSTPGDVSTITWNNNISVTKDQTYVGGVGLKPDGSKIFYIDTNSGGSCKVRSYDLNTPWDLASFDPASAASSDLITGSGLSNYLWGLQLSNDGTKLGTHNNGGSACVFSFGTAWDVTTLTFDNEAASVNNNIGSSFFGDGTGIISVTYSSTTVGFQKLTTAWDTSTANSALVINSFTDKGNGPTGIAINEDATRLYWITQSSGAAIGTATLNKTLL